jgi:hypothetical protein
MNFLNKKTLRAAAGSFVPVAAPLALLGSMATMNGGTALGTTGAFSTVVNVLTGLLASPWIMMIALIVLVAAVWQLANGGGYKSIGTILGVLAIALVGPGFLTTISTSMPTPAQQQVIAQAQAVAPAALQAQSGN